MPLQRYPPLPVQLCNVLHTFLTAPLFLFQSQDALQRVTFSSLARAQRLAAAKAAVLRIFTQPNPPPPRPCAPRMSGMT